MLYCDRLGIPVWHLGGATIRRRGRGRDIELTKCGLAERDQNASRCWPPSAPAAAATNAPISSAKAVKKDA